MLEVRDGDDGSARDYNLLLGLVAPRPIAWVKTRDAFVHVPRITFAD